MHIMSLHNYICPNIVKKINEKKKKKENVEQIKIEIIFY